MAGLVRLRSEQVIAQELVQAPRKSLPCERSGNDETRGITHSYEVRSRRDKRGFDLISDALPFGRLWYTKPDDAVDYAKFYSRSHHAVIRVYDDAGNVIETQEHEGRFQISYARVRVESRSKDDNFDRTDDLRSRNGVALTRSHCTMPDDRLQRWVDASSAAGAVESFMIPLVQGLGRFDCHLLNEDARFAALNQEQSSALHESTRLNDRLTLSYFWVLAA